MINDIEVNLTLGFFPKGKPTHFRYTYLYILLKRNDFHLENVIICEA